VFPESGILHGTVSSDMVSVDFEPVLWRTFGTLGLLVWKYTPSLKWGHCILMTSPLPVSWICCRALTMNFMQNLKHY